MDRASARTASIRLMIAAGTNQSFNQSNPKVSFDTADARDSLSLTHTHRIAGSHTHTHTLPLPLPSLSLSTFSPSPLIIVYKHAFING